ncbi:MAG: hypothetical protein Q8R91_08900 [Candidatus Omnitrophota bacterium]|nr:hypothetical protein [Candidatus Omnitrophota bacterium]
MPYSKQPDVQYTMRYCALLKREVRVVLMQQPDGGGRFVRCLDEEKACRCGGHRCPVSADERQWPYHFRWL